METIAKFRDPALGIKEFYDPVAKLEKAPLNEEKPASEAKKNQRGYTKDPVRQQI